MFSGSYTATHTISDVMHTDNCTGTVLSVRTYRWCALPPGASSSTRPACPAVPGAWDEPVFLMGRGP